MMPTIGLLVALSLSQAPAPAAAGRISGRVTVEGAGTPIASARIILLPAGRPIGPVGMPPQALTDRNGRFVFERVAAGEYRLDVQKAGFAPISGFLKRPPTITIAAGQSIDRVDVRLQKGGAITGRVLDTDGEPMTDTSVLVMRRSPSSAGGDRLFPAAMHGAQQTNDLGEFRVSGLAPGEYVLAAMPRGLSPFGGPGVLPTAGTGRTTTATTFYPGTTDQAAALPIVISAGAEVGNIVFTMQTTPAFRVSGIVLDESGKPVAHAMVTLLGDPRSGLFGPAGSALSQDDGRFVIGEVSPGSYRVSASMMMIGGGRSSSIGATVAFPPPGASGGSGGVSGGVFTFSSDGPGERPSEVVVADADVENVRVVARRPNAH